VTLRSIEEQVRPLVQVVVGPLEALAIALAEADPSDLVVLLRSGDRIEPDLVFRVADAVWVNARLEVVTWDDDVDVPGSDVRFRPVTWSPDLLLSTNPAGRSFAVVARAAARVGGLDPTAADPWWDLLLRLDPDPARVAHVPRVMTHLVQRDRSSVPAMAPSVALTVARRGWPATVEVVDGSIRLHWALEAWPSVSVVVPTRHNRPMLDGLLPGLRRTDYPDWELIVVDNGGRTDERQEWYRDQLEGLDHSVIWWTEPFNYNRVNNAAVDRSRGEIVILLNDDTEIRSPDWIRELVGWATRSEVGTVGVQLVNGDGLIQHGGVVIGMSGFADHLFAGCRPHSETPLGSADWYRNTSANTAACVALERSLWDRIGGLDERFELLGSDVVVGLDAMALGFRNVTTAAIDVRHLESVTRGSAVPERDMFASYWRYHRWLRVGDPYFTPSLSLEGPELQLRRRDEPSPLERIGPMLGRGFGVFRQRASEEEAAMLADLCRIDEPTIHAVRSGHALVQGLRHVRTVNWFLPDIENPFYGGIATALRIAEHLRQHHGVENRFVIWSSPNEAWFRSALQAIFPGLAGSELFFYDGHRGPALGALPPCDVAIATQWPTAYAVAAVPGAERRFYLIQDFEPMFHPAGTLYALAEESYRLGLYGLCNTVSMARFYREDYGGTASSFVPAVDTEVFHARGRIERGPEDPVTVFLYARPGHWRNCWELVSLALAELKARYGRRLRIVTAGSWARPEDLGSGIEHLGLLDYRATGDLYRSCDIGISLTVSPHPSYLPLELMACGAAVVAFDLPPGYWILDDGVDCVLSRRTVTGLVEQVSRLVDDDELRNRIQAGGRERIARRHSDWDGALSRVYHALCDPERFGDRDAVLDPLDNPAIDGEILRGIAPVPADG
jgi:GT2 family glycosyltransferase/glycosyltransferase involved in cell wall biosynthesis